MTTPHSRLSVKQLRKSFKQRQVVQDFSLDIESGEVVGLLGPNGAGKTTSFYMIVGLVAADHGTIRLDGHELRHMTVYQRARLGLGYLPQEASIFRKMTVEENIRAILQLHETDRDAIEAHLNDLLADLNITHLRQSPAPALSGGERRRVEIARVLAMSPRFILLDEPFAGVDPIAVIDIQNIINFLKQRGIAKPCASATGPISSTTAPCWPAAAPKNWWATKKSAPCIWAKTSITKVSGSLK